MNPDRIKNNIFAGLISLLLLLLTQCSYLTIRDTFYTDQEAALLEKTLTALDYSYGYDADTELNYVYSYSYSRDNTDKKEKEFTDVISKTEFNELLMFYDKIMELNAATDYKLEKYKKETNWKYYTFIKKDLLDPLKRYTSLLNKYIIEKKPELNAELTKKQQSIRKKTEREYREQEEVVDTF